MMYRKGGMLVFLCFLCVHYSQSSSLPVPLLSWSNSDGINEVPAITYGQTNELSEVYKKYIEPTIKSKYLVLLFLQDELSNDDFTKYSSSFPHLQKVLETKKYLLFPSVSKEKSINELISGSTNNIDYVDSGSLNDWNYKLPSSNVNNVIVFNLEPVSGSHSKGKGEILARNDLVMHRIIKTLKEQVKDFNVVYTAEDPSQMVANFLLDEKIAEVGFGSRHLLAENNGTTATTTAVPTTYNGTQTLFNNTCVLMHVTSIQYGTTGNMSEFITPGPTTRPTWNVSDCDNDCSMTLSRKFDLNIININSTVANVTIIMEFSNDTQQMLCDRLIVSGHYAEGHYPDGDETNGRFETTFDCNNSYTSFVYDTIVAPIAMSYACHKLAFRMNDTFLVLGNFQVQTFCSGKDETRSRFASAYDCVGFFTIEILTGIFVTIVLLIGLYIGIMMMMAIQVQDRFDDPKGKTINTITTHNE